MVDSYVRALMEYRTFWAAAFACGIGMNVAYLARLIGDELRTRRLESRATRDYWWW
jgi:hypothetical protein